MGRASNARATLDGWYRTYLFPAMASQELLGDMQSNRSSIEKDLALCADAAMHQMVVDIVYEEATKRASGNYHPAVRFNALLVIGNLNQEEDRTQQRLPAVRLPKALDFLLAEYKKPDQLPVVKLGCLLGIERHVELGRVNPQDQALPDPAKQEIRTLMTALIQEKPAADASVPDAQTWLRRRALSVLGKLGDVGAGNGLLDTLVNLASDQKEPMPIRLAAAKTIGELDYAQAAAGAQANALLITQKLAALAASACREEDTWVKAEQKKLLEEKAGAGSYSSGGAGYGLSGMGGAESGMGGEMEGEGSGYGYGYGGPGRKDDATTLLMTNARRRIKFPIFCVQLGIRGGDARSSSDTLQSVAALADAQQQEKIKEILAVLDKMIEITDQVDETLTEVMADLRSETRTLEALLPESVLADPDEEAGDLLPGADLPGADLPGGAAAPAGGAAPGGAPGGAGAPTGGAAPGGGAGNDLPGGN